MATGGFIIQATEGSASAIQTLATFTDPGGAEPVGDYTATVDWGDGSTTAGAISLGADGQTYRGVGSPKYPDQGNYPVTVTIHHGTVTDCAAGYSAAVAELAVVAVASDTATTEIDSVSPHDALAT